MKGNSEVLKPSGANDFSSPTPRLSRREILKMGSILLASNFMDSYKKAADAGQRINEFVKPLLDYDSTWTRVEGPNDTFLKDNAEAFGNLRIGCSFAPEVIWTLMGNVSWEEKKKASVKALKFAVKDLGVRDVRFGIRPSTVLNKEAKIDLDGYEPLLEFCSGNNVSLCLAEGWPKMFRWPENHLPNYLRGKNILPPHDTVIGPEIEFAEIGLDYLEALNQKLKDKYGKDLSSIVRIIQPENEPFYNFGEFGWTVSPDYLTKVIDIISSYFPNRDILVNSPGPFSVQKIQGLAQKLQGGFRQSDANMKYGFDYYYQIDDEKINNIPFLGRLVKHTDIIAVYKAMGWSLYPQGMPREVTEGQMVGWGRYQTPGNSVKHLRFMTLRCAENLLKPGNDRLLRVWGVEELAFRRMFGGYTEEHMQMEDLIRKVNAVS